METSRLLNNNSRLNKSNLPNSNSYLIFFLQVEPVSVTEHVPSAIKEVLPPPSMSPGTATTIAEVLKPAAALVRASIPIINHSIEFNDTAHDQHIDTILSIAKLGKDLSVPKKHQW